MNRGSRVYTTAFASTGAPNGNGYGRPTWRTRTCSVCGAVPQERCFHWVKERFTAGATGGNYVFQGEGRKVYNKHPHPERKKEMNDE